MSATGLLEALKRHDLIQYYPILMEQNIVSLNKLARLPETDYTKLGVLHKDIPKLEALAKQYVNYNSRNAASYSPTKAAKSSPTRPSNPNNSIIPTTAPVVMNIPTHNNKRLTFKSPPRNATDRNKRRMTMTSQAMIPRTFPAQSKMNSSNNSQTASSNSRRLSSYAFSPVSNRRLTIHKSPNRPNPPVSSTNYGLSTPKRPAVSPKRYNTLSQPQRPASKPTLTATVTVTKTATPMTTSAATTGAVTTSNTEAVSTENVPSTRSFDAYGIPILSQKQKLPSVPSTNPVGLYSANSNTNKYRNQETDQSNQQTQQSSPVRNNSYRTHTLLSSTMNPELNQRIRVCVRKRPLNKKELNNQESDVATLVSSRTIQIHAPKTRIDLTPFTETHSFTFDDAFDEHTTNEEIYARTAKPLVEYVFTGGKATCFAHGQTGSGKTYTMLDPQHGLYVLAAHDIFHLLQQPEYLHLTASIGFYEIYQGQLFDLLNKKNKLNAREDGNGNVVIAGLKEYTIENVDQLMQVFDYGNASRTTGRTGANNTSSRSHAVLQICLRSKTTVASPKLYGKLIFIDLAGSERGADRGDANTQTRMEGAEINKSLLALKECIRALDQNKSHTPFRGSKLTQVLRDSFTGDSRTCMIATISPNVSNSEHTLNTLRYADRVKQLRGESDPRLLTSNNDYTYSMTTTADLSRSPLRRQQMKDEELYEGTEDVMENYPRPIEVDAFDTDSIKNYSLDNYDNHSIAASSDIWEEAGVSENLFEVDFPVSQTALATPNNESSRHYSRSSTTDLEPPPTTPRRKAKYMKRLESPPEEVFQQDMDNKFFTPPLGPIGDDDVDDIPPIPVDYSPGANTKIPTHPSPSIHNESNSGNRKRSPPSFDTLPYRDNMSMTSKRLKVEEEPTDDDPHTRNGVNMKSTGNNLSGIQRFLSLHKTQLKGFDQCLRQEREMAQKLERLITSNSNDNNEDATCHDPEIIEAYEDFLNDLVTVTETKYALLAALSKELDAKRIEQQH